MVVCRVDVVDAHRVGADVGYCLERRPPQALVLVGDHVVRVAQLAGGGVARGAVGRVAPTDVVADIPRVVGNPLGKEAFASDGVIQEVPLDDDGIHGARHRGGLRRRWVRLQWHLLRRLAILRLVVLVTVLVFVLVFVLASAITGNVAIAVLPPVPLLVLLLVFLVLLVLLLVLLVVLPLIRRTLRGEVTIRPVQWCRQGSALGVPRVLLDATVASDAARRPVPLLAVTHGAAALPPGLRWLLPVPERTSCAALQCAQCAAHGRVHGACCRALVALSQRLR
mmetsp:Transcript_104052/g.310750  ORF Transcript_104052/g.310750 Transcript_104052/m.310750 type:complete len:281 (-) Transcript_104052:49-891(-)